jgi:hypothetical protein
VRIGRSRDNDLILPNLDSSTASGRHAEARVDARGCWWIDDQGSSNGTRVNGVATHSHALKNGDRVAFGDEEFVVTIGPERRRRAALAAAALLITAAAVFGISRWQARPSFEAAVRQVAPSIFMVALEEEGRRTVVGTAFVAAPGVLATSAHIADALAVRGALGARRAVVVGREGSPVVSIAGVTVHPQWRRGSIQWDTALLDTAGAALPPPLRLAASEPAALGRGTLLGTFGFPGVTTNAAKPTGRLAVDVVAAVRPGFLEIGLGIAPGVSGSPVFDETGLVVGMVAGGDFVTGPNGLPVPSGSSANWAIRIAALRELLASR